MTGRSSRNRLQLRIGMSRWQLRVVRPAEELVGPGREEHVAGEGPQLHAVAALSVASAAHFARSSRPQPMCERP